jgi:soluble epoxide hydrolase/lipid-phosphate phosphatase
MDSLQHKTLATSRGYTYSYYVSPEIVQSRPTLLLHHGFPDSAHLWARVVANLTPCNLVIPDLLGYAGTSKPTDPAVYGFDGIAQDLVDILDAEKIEKVISAGHDFGSVVAQRLYIFHPDRVEGLILLNVGYLLPPPSQPDLKQINEHLTKMVGYPLLAYQEFFVTDEAPKIIEANLDRFYHALHGAPADWMRDMFCTTGGLRNWLLDEDSKVELSDFAKDPEMHRSFVDRFRRDKFEGPLCYYKSTTSDVQFNTTKDIPKDRFIVKAPVLFIGCSRDILCRPEIMQPAKQGGCLPDFEEAMIDSGHWCPLEKPAEVAKLMNSFLEKRFSS